MKKLISILLILLVLVGCGSSTKTNEENKDNTDNVTNDKANEETNVDNEDAACELLLTQLVRVEEEGDEEARTTTYNFEYTYDDEGRIIAYRIYYKNDYGYYGEGYETYYDQKVVYNDDGTITLQSYVEQSDQLAFETIFDENQNYLSGEYGTYTYEYDENGRIISEDNGGQKKSFTYDDNGMIVEVTYGDDDISGEKYNFDADNLVRSFDNEVGGISNQYFIKGKLAFKIYDYMVKQYENDSMYADSYVIVKDSWSFESDGEDSLFWNNSSSTVYTYEGCGQTFTYSE